MRTAADIAVAAPDFDDDHATPVGPGRGAHRAGPPAEPGCGRRWPGPSKTRIFVVANQKGGVGKTTSTVNIAAALAQLGQRVLVIDLDPQGNASTALGVEHRRGVPSTYDALVDGEPARRRDRPSRPRCENLCVVPATIDLAGAEIELVWSSRARAGCARPSHGHPLVGTAAEAGEDRFDYVLIDCPPSLGLLTLNALVAGDEMLIPIQAEYYALEGLGQLLETVEMVRAHLNPKLDGLHDPGHHVRRPHPARLRRGRGGARALRRPGAQDVDPALGAGLGGAVVRPDRDDLRSGIAGRAVLPRSRARDRHPGSQPMNAAVPRQRRGLGRGLGSLIPTGPAATPGGGRTATAPRRRVGPAAGRSGLAPVAGAYFAELPVGQIKPNRGPAAPGLRRGGDGRAGPLDQGDRACSSRSWYAGTARTSTSWSWASAAGARPSRPASTTIPAIVRETDDVDMLRDALLENLHRSQLNPLEEAAAYAQMLDDFGCTHEELASRIGRSRPQISNTLRLLKLTPGRPAPGRRRRALGRPRPVAARRSRTPRSRTGWRQRVVAEGISVRGLEEIVADAATPTAPRRGGPHEAGRRPAWSTSPSGSPTGSRPGSRSTSAAARARSPSSSPRSTTCSGSSTSWTRATASDRPI